MSALSMALEIIGYDLTGGAFGSIIAKLGMLDSAGAGAGAGVGSAASSMLALEGAVAAAGIALAAFTIGTKAAVDAGAQLQMAGTMAAIAISDGAQHVNELETAIVNLANNSQYKIADVDQAFRMLGERGFDTAQILAGGLGQASINLGQAMGDTAVNGADVLSQALRLMTNDHLTAAHAADELTRAFYDGMPAASDLSTFLGLAGGTANNLHMSLQDLLVAGDLLTPVMGGASQAGASLNYMLNQLVAPTGPAASAIKELNLQVFDGTGKFVGFKDVIDQLILKMKDMPDEQKFPLIRGLFSTRSGRGAQDLIGMLDQFDVRYTKIRADLGQVGTAQKDSAAINDTATGSWNRLTTTVNDFFARSGQGINTVLIPLYNGLNSLFSTLQQSPTVTTFFAAFLVGGVVLAGLALVVGGLVLAFVFFGSIIAPFAIVLGGIVLWAGALAGAFTILTTKGQLFSGWLSFLNPVVDAVRGAFAAMWQDIQSQNWTPLLDVGKALLFVLGALAGLIAWVLVGAVLALGLAIMGIVDWFGQMSTWVGKMMGLLHDLSNVFADVGKLIFDFMTGRWDNLAGDVTRIQKDWNADMKRLADQQAADQKAAADKAAYDATQAALKKKKDVLDAAAQEADGKAKAAKQEADYDQQMANQAKDAATKAYFQKAADVANAQYQEQTQVAASARQEASDVQTQMNNLKTDASNIANQTQQNVVNSFNQLNGRSVEQVRDLRNQAKANYDDMKNETLADVNAMSTGTQNVFQTLANSSSTWGYDLAQNFANGIASGDTLAAIAANRIAMKVAATLEHSKPKEGPLANDDEWGGHLVDNFIGGMLSRLPSLGDAATQVAGTLAGTLSTPAIAGQQAGFAAPLLPVGVQGGQQVVIPIYIGEDLIAEYGANLVTKQLTMNGMGRQFR